MVAQTATEAYTKAELLANADKIFGYDLAVQEAFREARRERNQATLGEDVDIGI